MTLLPAGDVLRSPFMALGFLVVAPDIASANKNHEIAGSR